MSFIFPIVALIIGIIITGLIFLLYIKSKLEPKFKQLLIDQAAKYADDLERIVVERIKRSKSVITGQQAEQVAPFLPEFPYNPSDARFLGSPIDFVVFDGLSKGKLEEIVIVEVKTGKSGLTTRERAIKKAVREGRVSFKEIRLRPTQKDVKNVKTQ